MESEISDADLRATAVVEYLDCGKKLLLLSAVFAPLIFLPGVLHCALQVNSLGRNNEGRRLLIGSGVIFAVWLVALILYAQFAHTL